MTGVPTVRILYDVDGWAYHRRALALRRYAPADFEITIAALPRLDHIDAALGDDEPDIVFAISHPELRTLRRVLDARGWRSKLVGSWNCGWPLRIAEFYPTYRDADALVINNTLSWERLGQLPNTYRLTNGVDGDLFRVRVPIETRQPKVLWTGSQLGRLRKGYERFLLPLQEGLRRRGIACDLLLVDSYSADKRSAEEMVDWYNSGTVFVSASSTEGTPNTALEAAACGCAVVSTASGNMPELIRDDVNGYLVERTAEALLAGVRKAVASYPRLAAEMQRDIRAWDWRQRSAGFYDMFRAVLERGSRGRRSASPPPDLSERVTVFVTTVGAPSYAACVSHLIAQDSTFRLQVIEDVAPMSRAFQTMLDDCATPFFVQVDEDMLLYPHAIRTLHELINAADERTAMAVADLYDAHLERCLLGVKIYRHAIVARYPFANAQSFEKLQMQELRNDGYEILWTPPGTAPTKEHTLGLHGTHWTADSIYERYATLERRRRGHPRDLAWFAEYPNVFLRRYLDEPSELNFFALFGLLSGALAANGSAADKDFRTYNSLPGLREARQLFAQMQSGDVARLPEA